MWAKDDLGSDHFGYQALAAPASVSIVQCGSL
jgi:hypothetical protein